LLHAEATKKGAITSQTRFLGLTIDLLEEIMITRAEACVKCDSLVPVPPSDRRAGAAGRSRDAVIAYKPP
jgi:hypothetical protein